MILDTWFYFGRLYESITLKISFILHECNENRRKFQISQTHRMYIQIGNDYSAILYNCIYLKLIKSINN